MTQKVKQPRSAMSARLLELSAETSTPEPYPVTETIVVQPPTRTRRKDMNAAEMKMYLCTQLLSQAINAASAPEPDGEDLVAHAEWVAEREAAQEKVDSINKQHAAAETDFEKAFFGDAHEAVIEYFEDKPVLWDKFVPDIRSEFLPAVPDDGKCPTCGHVNDEEAEGKAPESSI
jgi:hypothetical protein